MDPYATPVVPEQRPDIRVVVTTSVEETDHNTFPKSMK